MAIALAVCYTDSVDLAEREVTYDCERRITERLGEQKRRDKDEGPEMVAEWRESLTVLFRQFTQWLAEAVANNLLRVGEVALKIQEERLGEYDARALRIFAPNGETVSITPKARALVLGASGRVDFVCGPRAATSSKRTALGGNLPSWPLSGADGVSRI